MPIINVIYASTSGHTKHVIDILSDKISNIEYRITKAEEATSEDLLEGNVLILACGTWNLDGVEGHLNPHMNDLLNKRCKDIDLGGKNVAIIALGDDRYYYTGRATEHLMQFVLKHNGKPLGAPLLIINEPYGQEDKITKWADNLVRS